MKKKRDGEYDNILSLLAIQAYFCASVVVLYNVEAQTQRHYRNHTNDVECLCAHPADLPLCATGQAEGLEGVTGTVQRPHVQVCWVVSIRTCSNPARVRNVKKLCLFSEMCYTQSITPTPFLPCNQTSIN